MKLALAVGAVDTIARTARQTNEGRLMAARMNTPD
jgi:hypothetical protein